MKLKSLKQGGLSDIVTYSDAGENCSQVLYCTRVGAGTLTIVYNYK